MNKIKTSIAAAIIAMVGISSPAFAGGVQVDDKSLTDILVSKGVLSKAEAKAVKHNSNGRLKIGGKLYLNSTYANDKVTTAGTQKDTKSRGLNVDRAYLTARYSYNKNWMARITLDMANQDAVSNLSKDQVIFLKYAYVQGKLLDDAAVLRLGQSHTPWIDYQEEQNEHRFVFKTYVDTYGFETSSDLGVGLKGDLLDGLVEYWVTETNGTGYSKGNFQSGNNATDFSSRISLFPIEHVSLDFGYSNGFHASKTFKSGVGVAGIKSVLYQAQITYITHEYGMGIGLIGNTDTAKDATSYTKKHGSSYTLAAANDRLESDGFYVWGRSELPVEHFAVFGNYEYLKNKLKKIAAFSTAPDEKIKRYVFGVDYSPVKHLTFSAVVDITSFDNPAGVAANDRTINKFGIYSETKF